MVATEDGPVWKPELDGDGNALGGIRLPEIEAPLGVYTGFDFSWLEPAVAEKYPYAIVFAYGGRFDPFSDEELAKRYPTEAAYRDAGTICFQKLAPIWRSLRLTTGVHHRTGGLPALC